MIETRPIRPEDAAACTAMAMTALRPVFRIAPQAYGDDIFFRMQPDWETERAQSLTAMFQSPDNRNLVAESASGIAGVISTTIDEATGLGNIDFIGVAASEQRKGVASALCARALGSHKDDGMAFTTAYLRDHDGHLPARNLLSSLGLWSLGIQPKTLIARLPSPPVPPVGRELTIRDLSPDDIDECARFGIEAFRPVFASFEDAYGTDLFNRLRPDWENAQTDYIRAVCAENPALVAVADEAVVGFVVLEPRLFRGMTAIELLAVSPGYDGRGIGTALNSAALGRIVADGMDYAIVSTGSDPGHAPARRSYAKVGFSPAPVHWHLMATEL